MKKKDLYLVAGVIGGYLVYTKVIAPQMQTNAIQAQSAANSAMIAQYTNPFGFQ